MAFLSDQLGSLAGRLLTNLTQDRDTNRVSNAGDLQTDYNHTRDDVRGKARAIGFDGDFRKPSVVDTDNFEKHDLAALRTKVDQINLESVTNLKDAWDKIGTQETTSLTTYQQAWSKVTNENVWRGEARNAAAQSVTDYTTQASKVAKAAALTSNKLSELATGLAPTKALVPHVPSHRSGVNNAFSLVTGRGWRDDVTAYDNAYAEAKRVLTTVYAPVVHESDTGVPVIPKPNQHQPGPGDQPPPSTTWPPGGKNPGQPVPGGDQNGPNNPNQDQNPNSQNPQSNNPSENQNGSQNPSDQAKTDPSAATNAAGVDPNSLGSGSGSSVPGGAGGGLGGSSGSSAPGAGASVPLAATPNAASAGRAGSAASRAGASGMPGMGGGAGRGKGEKEEERTKSVADYLINQENGDELTGIPALPKTVPPVIGE
ncbi:hypothetical protein [Nocardia spumae]|uniref:hypothetical protein n=1 Tax=Nocardia spumae TaxID=2887190 RepID=UPI001D1596A1|nr:hypothetical protein [Nocardia spumae]